MNKDEIKKLAELSRIEISDTDIDSYQKDFDTIFSYINTIQSVKLNDSSDVSYLHTNIMREDEQDVYVAGADTDALLQEVPESENGFIRVQKIL